MLAKLKINLECIQYTGKLNKDLKQFIEGYGFTEPNEQGIFFIQLRFDSQGWKKIYPYNYLVKINDEILIFNEDIFSKMYDIIS